MKRTVTALFLVVSILVAPMLTAIASEDDTIASVEEVLDNDEQRRPHLNEDEKTENKGDNERPEIFEQREDKIAQKENNTIEQDDIIENEETNVSTNEIITNDVKNEAQLLDVQDTQESTVYIIESVGQSPVSDISLTYGDEISWEYKITVKGTYNSDLYVFSVRGLEDIGNNFVTSVNVFENSVDEFYFEVKITGDVTQMPSYIQKNIVYKVADTNLASLSVQIDKADVTQFEIDEISDIVYGEDKNITYILTGVSSENEDILEPYDTVTIEYYTDDKFENISDNAIDVGTYYVKVVYSGDDYYNLVAIENSQNSFTIYEKSILDCISLEAKEYFQLKEDVIEKDVSSYLVGLEEDTDYTVTYACTETSLNKVEVIIEGIGNYCDSTSFAFEVELPEGEIWLVTGSFYTLYSDDENLIGWTIDNDGILYSNGISFYVYSDEIYSIAAVYSKE